MVLLAARQAQAWYLTAAGRTSDADSAVLYRHLAQEEERRLRQLDTRRGLLAAEHAPLRELPADDGGAPWPEPGLTPLEVLAMAIEEEMATYRILTDIASRNLDPQGRVVLEQLATEERELLDRLQKLSESEALRLLSLFPASAG